jgi:hypothetical protein
MEEEKIDCWIDLTGIHTIKLKSDNGIFETQGNMVYNKYTKETKMKIFCFGKWEIIHDYRELRKRLNMNIKL